MRSSLRAASNSTTSTVPFRPLSNLSKAVATRWCDFWRAWCSCLATREGQSKSPVTSKGGGRGEGRGGDPFGGDGDRRFGGEACASGDVLPAAAVGRSRRRGDGDGLLVVATRWRGGDSWWVMLY